LYAANAKRALYQKFIQLAQASRIPSFDERTRAALDELAEEMPFAARQTARPFPKLPAVNSNSHVE
ncbi:MAG: hypothetical protein LBJ64_01580, partial [Deltaproteobacteria bacterium]|nr:hypothetical protein [Deltaproteobacteria bacterium]